MCKQLISAILISATLVATVVSLAENENNYLQELIDAGISKETAEGIVAVGEKYKPSASDPNSSGKTIFESILRETDEYLKGRSAEDQQAYAAFVASTKQEFEQPSDASKIHVDENADDTDVDVE